LQITKKGALRLADRSHKVYQLLAHGRWFSPGTPAFSTTTTGRHDIAEILLKVALNTIKIKSLIFIFYFNRLGMTPASYGIPIRYLTSL
jgi:hypothetical protein